MRLLACLLFCLLAVGKARAAEPTTNTADTPPKRLTILAIGAHMDDAEGGIGSILISAVRAGHRVVVVVTVSDYRTWGPTIGREAQCKAEQLALAKRFGYEKRFLDYPYHQFPDNNEARQKLAEIYVELLPDIAFVQNTEDHWPDHVNTGAAGKDAVLFAHGYTEQRNVRRCPRVFAYCAAPGQTIRFDPDFFVDATPVMAEYMDLMAGADGCLTGKPVSELLQYEARNLKTNEMLKMSSHGWLRQADCIRWGAMSGSGMTYGMGLKTLWGPKDGRPLW